MSSKIRNGTNPLSSDSSSEDDIKNQRKPSRLKIGLQYLISIFLALLVSTIVIKVYHPVFVSGSSMEPTYQNGNVLISTSEFDYDDIKIGDVVVFKEKIQLIKRVVAKGGDTISVVGGILFVNGEKSPYQFESIDSPGILKEPYTLKSQELFCMGDNRNHSTDCREFGAISFDQIEYKIIRKAFK